MWVVCVCVSCSVQLSGLVRDAAYFKSYLASSFLVLKDTMQVRLRTHIYIHLGTAGLSQTCHKTEPQGLHLLLPQTMFLCACLPLSCPQATLVALGACKRPLPGFSEREPVEDSAMYGRVAPIDDMITSLPPVSAQYE